MAWTVLCKIYMRVLLALVLLSGCTVSPQPTPPPVIDVSRLSISEASGSITLSGTRGAIIHATSLNVFKATNGYSVITESVPGDGSFSVTLSGAIDDQLRLQAIEEDDGRSTPLDVVGTPAGEVVSAPRFDCMTLDAEPEIDFGPGPLGVPSTQRVTIRNDCTMPVDIAPAEVAAAFVPDFVLTPLGEPSITPGEVTPFDIGYQRVADGEHLVFVVFGWSAASAERRVITVRGSAQ